MVYLKKILCIILISFASGCITLEKREISGILTPPELHNPNTPNLTLDKGKAAEVALSLDWDAPVYGAFEVAVAYELQLSSDQDFSNVTSVSVPSGKLSHSLTQQELSMAVVGSLKALPGVSTDVFIRVLSKAHSSIETLYSNSTKINVSPFDPFVRKFILIEGKPQESAVSIFSPTPTTQPDYFDGYLYFEAGSGFKIYTSFSDDPLGDIDPSGTSKKLSINGNYIEITDEGVYHITINTETDSYSTDKTEWGIVGSATKQGWNADDKLVYNKALNVFEIKDYSLNSGEFKFRANGLWDLNIGKSKAGRGQQNEYLDYGGDNFVQSESGSFDIVLDLSNSTFYNYQITKK